MAGASAAELEWPLKGDRLERHKYLLDKGFLSDSVLVLGNEQKEVKVHRFLLEISSPVFHKDFQKCNDNRLVIPNVDPQIFMLLIRHVYLGECGAKPEECFPLLNLASHYKIQDLMEFCSKSLDEDITNDNVITLFQQAMEFGHADLIEFTLTYLCSNAAEIVNSDEFAELRQECLYEILKRDDLRVSNELEIFNAVMRWGEAECNRQKLDSNEPKNIRKVLCKVLGLIRFPVMEAEEFTLNVAIRNLLENEELISMLLFFNVSKINRARVPQGRFNAAPRNYLKVLGSTLYSAPRLLKGNKRSNGMLPDLPETLQFKATQAIFLVGLKTFHSSILYEYGCRELGGYIFNTFQLTISLESVSSGNSLMDQVKESFSLLESEINFDTPVDLEADCWYSITVSITGMLNGKALYNFGNGPTACQTISNVKCEEKGGVQNVCFEFRRGEGNKNIPIEHGMIQELLFKTYCDKKASSLT